MFTLVLTDWQKTKLRLWAVSAGFETQGDWSDDDYKHALEYLVTRFLATVPRVGLAPERPVLPKVAEKFPTDII